MASSLPNCATRPYLGKNVDVYYTDFGFLNRQYFNMYNLNERREYNIKQFFSTGGTKLCAYPSVVDIQAIVYKNHQFADLITYYDKYYKQWISGGILAIFAAVTLGYNNIYLIGLDLYKTDKPYPWQQGKTFIQDFPRDREENLMNVINKFHPKFLQIKSLLMVKEIQGIRLLSLSEESPINEYIELAPVIKEQKHSVVDKPANYMKDWLPLPNLETPKQPVLKTNSDDLGFKALNRKLDFLIQNRFKIIPRSLGLFLSCFIFKKKNRRNFRKKYVKDC